MHTQTAFCSEMVGYDSLLLSEHTKVQENVWSVEHLTLFWLCLVNVQLSFLWAGEIKIIATSLVLSNQDLRAQMC